MSRDQHRLDWARAALAAPGITLESASSDASARSYWRVRGQPAPLLLMDAPPESQSLAGWLAIGARLRTAGLRTPRVFAENHAEGFLLIEDFGDRLLLPALRDDTVDALYRRALDALFALQTRVDPSALPRYDEQRLVAELELMPTWFLQRHLGYTPECEQWDVIETAFRVLLDNAAAQPQCCVHRDFHSRNLLLPDDGALGIIDFQDAVHGPITYDLVSLLRDCYIAWPDPQVYAWVDGYRQRLLDAGRIDADVDIARFRRWFDLIGLQRHIKVLGIFCRLWYRDGKPGYLRDLPLVWRYVRDVGLRYPRIAPLIELLERAIGGRDITVAADPAM